jgi:hypothetical protein
VMVESSILAEDLRQSPEFRMPVWRYLTLGKFLSLLELQAVWFSRLGTLIDTFEGTIPPLTKRAMDESSQEWLPVFPRPEHQEMIRRMADKNEDDGRVMCVVSCWFIGERESSHMWEAYASLTEGVAIRSSCERLVAGLGLHREVTRIQKVRYVDFATVDLGLYKGGQVYERAFLKRLEYAAEQELRVATMNIVHSYALNEDGTPPTEEQRTGPGQFDPDRQGLYIRTNLNRLVESVRVSPKAGSWFFDIVRRVSARYGLTCEVSHSALQLDE